MNATQPNTVTVKKARDLKYGDVVRHECSPRDLRVHVAYTKRGLTRFYGPCLTIFTFKADANVEVVGSFK